MIGAIGMLRDMRELDKARAYAESLIKNAPDPVFVSDLEGKILQANDAVSELLGFRRTRCCRAVALALHQRRGDARVHRRPPRGRRARRDPQRAPQPASASGEVIPTTLNASALRDPDGNVIGAIGILRDMRAYEEVVRDLEESKSELQEKILDLEKFEEVVVGRELKMIALEKELEGLQREVAKLKAEAAAADGRRLGATAAGDRRRAGRRPRRCSARRSSSSSGASAGRRSAAARSSTSWATSTSRTASSPSSARRCSTSSPTTRRTAAGLAQQTERLDNSRRALLHILKDSHESNLRLGRGARR